MQLLGRSVLDAVPVVPARQAPPRAGYGSLSVSERRAGSFGEAWRPALLVWRRCSLLSVPQAFVPSSPSSLEQKIDVRVTT